LQRETLPALALGAEETLDADAELGVAFFEAQAEGGDLHAKIERCDAQWAAVKRLRDCSRRARSRAPGARSFHRHAGAAGAGDERAAESARAESS